MLVGVAAVFVSLLVCVGGLWVWGKRPGALGPTGSFRSVVLQANLDNLQLLQHLEQVGILEGAELARAYQLVLHPWFEYAPGAHWLRSGHSAAEVLKLVARSRARPVVRVSLPEGWDSFQMAEKLANAGVCGSQEFVAHVLGHVADPDATNQSLEGHLYPASYDLWLNSTPHEVTERLNKEARQRFERVFAAAAPRTTALQQRLGLGPQDVVTLASIVEKEAANTDELPLIASVFLNRLRDPNFRPARMLQSDPTAGYGCKVYKDLPSCAAYTGRVTPLMLRDANNPFNTYKHPGLPPTPIGNPSTRSVEAVLNAPNTNYYFFVSHNGKAHQFSETLQTHEAATRTP